MTAKLSVSSAWDEKLGVWVGERAAAPDMSELPDPLYILGYGSLIWRPGSLLENCKTYKCTALGSMRLFAQRSCDHRGTPDFPGLVLNLVQDDVLEGLGYRTKDMHRSEFRGLVWHVPKEAVSAVIEDLDYRERGGYHRHIIPVHLDADNGGEHTEVDALVYTGAPSNPNFYLPPSLAPDTDVVTTDLSQSTEQTNHVAITKKEKLDAFNLCKRNVMTDTIAAAVGPSGPNVDYLCNLEAFLSSNDMHDPFLTDLATSVRLRLGIWRGRLYRGGEATLQQAVALQPSVKLTQKVLPYPLLGWGSNEFLQLSNSIHTSGENDGNGLLDHRYYPTLLSASLPSLLNTTIRNNENANANANPITTTADPATETDDPLHFAGLEERFVGAGGGTSAVLEQGNVRIFGSMLPQLTTHICNSALSVSTDRETDTVSDDAAVQNALRKYNQSIVIDNIDGVAVGHDHMLLLHRRPVRALSPALHAASTKSPNAAVQYEDVIVAVGSDSHGQCAGVKAAAAALGVAHVTPAELVLLPNPATNGTTFIIITSSGEVSAPFDRDDTLLGTPVAPGILKLAAGLRHSAAITVDGRLVTWGDNRHGQCLSGETTDSTNAFAWSPPNGAKLVDVACGAKFTIVIDDLGVVYSLGSPLGVAAVARSKGQAGQERSTSVPVVVAGLPHDVRWQRVTCGWSHVVLRGLSASMDRKLEFYAWGKQNLSQFVSSSDPDLAPLSELQAVEAVLRDMAGGGSEEVAPLKNGEAVSFVTAVGTASATGTALLVPRPLAPLPEGHSIAEVWCGSEYTIVADEAGGLWACGWNEHGNLGVGSPSSHLSSPPSQSSPAAVVQKWARVQGYVEDEKCIGTGGLQLSHVWEGAVACGGGHVLCLP